MLVLSRRDEERIMIGDDIIVQILEIRPGRVRVGITAPDNIIIAREEVWAPQQLELPFGSSVDSAQSGTKTCASVKGE